MPKGVDSGALRAVTSSASEVRTDDWPAQATDAIVNVVGTAHDKITGPVRTIAKALVWGIFAAVLATVAIVIAIIGALRALNAYLPDSIFGSEHMWAAYFCLGVLLTAIGLTGLAVARRQPVAEDD